MTAPHPSPDPDHLDRLINEIDAADYLGLSERTLQKWRVTGGGPRFVKVSGRMVRYRRRDLMDWSEARLRAHTSEAPA